MCNWNAGADLELCFTSTIIWTQMKARRGYHLPGKIGLFVARERRAVTIVTPALGPSWKNRDSTFELFFPTSSSLPLALRLQARASGAACPQRKCSQVPSPPRRFCTKIRKESQNITKSDLKYRGFLLYLSPPGKGAADLYALLHHIAKISCQFYSSTCPSLLGFLIIEVWGDVIVTFAAPGREFLYKGWSRPWMSRQDQEPLPQAGKGIVCR